MPLRFALHDLKGIYMWKSFPDGNGGFVIYQIDDAGNKIGNTVGDSYQSKPLADIAVKGMITDAGLGLVDEDGSYGPTVLAVAATNEPFIGLKDHPSEIVQIDDAAYVRVPFLMQGYYNHPWYGPLIFNQPKIDKIIQNHVMGVAEAPVYYRVRHAENPSVAFFDLDRGGWFAEEEVNGDKLLVAYGPVVDEQRALETVRDYVCASMDIDENYIPFRVQKFSKRSIHVFSINASWNYSRTRLTKEAIMKRKVTIAGVTVEIDVTEAGYVFDEAAIEQLQAITLPEADAEDLQPQVDQLTVDLTAARDQVVQLEARIKELGGETEPEVSPAVRQRLEALERRAQEAERRELNSQINNVVQLARSFRDDKGQGHSQVFINWLDKFLKLEAIGSGADIVRLAANYTAHDLRRYALEAGMWLSRNLPAVVPMEGGTIETDTNPMEGGDKGKEAELAAVAKSAVEKYTQRVGFKGKKLETNGKGK